jgi:hypothetical protein
MSGLPPKAAVQLTFRVGWFVPKAAVSRCSKKMCSENRLTQSPRRRGEQSRRDVKAENHFDATEDPAKRCSQPTGVPSRRSRRRTGRTNRAGTWSCWIHTTFTGLSTSCCAIWTARVRLSASRRWPNTAADQMVVHHNRSVVVLCSVGLIILARHQRQPEQRPAGLPAAGCVRCHPV